MVIPLHDPSIRLAVLGHLATGFNDQAVSSLGFSGDALQAMLRMRALKAAELEFLAGQRRVLLRVELLPDELHEALRAYAIRADQYALRDYFLRHGASYVQMTRFFSLSRARTLQSRRVLGVNFGAGRMRLPDLETRDFIAVRWKKTQAEDPRERLVRLHEQFPEYTLAVLEWVVEAAEVAP